MAMAGHNVIGADSCTNSSLSSIESASNNTLMNDASMEPTSPSSLSHRSDPLWSLPKRSVPGELRRRNSSDKYPIARRARSPSAEERAATADAVLLSSPALTPSLTPSFGHLPKISSAQASPCTSRPTTPSTEASTCSSAPREVDVHVRGCGGATDSPTNKRTKRRPLSVAEKGLLRTAISKPAALQTLNTEQVEQLVDSCTAKLYDDGELICEKSQHWPYFSCIVEGQMEVTSSNGKVYGTLAPGRWFGDFIKLDAMANVHAISVAALVVISREMVERVGLPDSRCANSCSNSSEGAAIKTVQFMEQMLGEGAFGKVLACKLSGKTDSFAIKCIDKSKVVKKQSQHLVINEMRLLKKVQHPFVVQLEATMQDVWCVYLVMEHLQGGEFFDHMIRVDTISERPAQFYIANVFLALQHMHDLEVVYRDLKPENLVFCKSGYLKLVDFGFAKSIQGAEKTFTICGTVEYMAPEVITGKGYGNTVDLWSAGVLLYEMLNGFVPYKSPNSILSEIYDKITTEKLQLGRNIQPKSSLASFVGSLLCINPKTRLGCTGKHAFTHLRNHAWFRQSQFDWGKLQRLELVPPYVPQCQPPTKQRIHYDAVHSQMLRFDPCPIWNPDLQLGF